MLKKNLNLKILLHRNQSPNFKVDCFAPNSHICADDHSLECTTRRSDMLRENRESLYTLYTNYNVCQSYSKSFKLYPRAHESKERQNIEIEQRKHSCKLRLEYYTTKAYIDIIYCKQFEAHERILGIIHEKWRITFGVQIVQKSACPLFLECTVVYEGIP